MACQGIIPEFGFGANSNAMLGEDNQNVQAQHVEEIGEIEVTNTGGPRASITHITQTVTPGNNGAGPSNPAPPQNISALLGLPEGETPSSWYAKQIATINAAYQSLSAQQAVLQAEPSLRNHEYYKPRQRIAHSEEAERDFSLAYRPAEAAEHSKFIPKIALAPLTKEKLPPTVGKFNGLTDPDDHVRVFTSVGVMGGWNMPMWCHLFIQTFTGAAHAWFDSLPPGKISSWVDFRTQFVNHFSQQRRYQRDTAEVTDIWRRENEGLEDFITRFNKECLEIGGVSEQLMRAHFKKAIRCDSLIRTITGKDGMPKEWDKLMEAAKIVAQTQESLAGNKNS
ncbi:uncharacterized protein LOC110943876 [Helianthus annuus]|uniref:uncharacterized protein LOC110943876 n=1 Tax=Helianthus annuus TaxID=4232 RepID=UPI000B8F3866|nr:uncharacterized protein LOC110943876 [Helianthus annuus]